MHSWTVCILENVNLKEFRKLIFDSIFILKTEWAVIKCSDLLCVLPHPFVFVFVFVFFILWYCVDSTYFVSYFTHLFLVIRSPAIWPRILWFVNSWEKLTKDQKKSLQKCNMGNWKKERFWSPKPNVNIYFEKHQKEKPSRKIVSDIYYSGEESR